MELLPPEVREQLPRLYSQENELDPMVICKFSHTLSHWTWYAYEDSPVDEHGYYDTDKEKVDFVFFGWVYGDFPELGYFSLSELESVNVMGLGIERNIRDKKFKKVPGGYHLTRGGILSILTNPIYIGWLILNGDI